MASWPSNSLSILYLRASWPCDSLPEHLLVGYHKHQLKLIIHFVFEGQLAMFPVALLDSPLLQQHRPDQLIDCRGEGFPLLLKETSSFEAPQENASLTENTEKVQHCRTFLCLAGFFLKRPLL